MGLIACFNLLVQNNNYNSNTNWKREQDINRFFYGWG